VKLDGCIASRGTSYAILNLLEMLDNVLKMAGNEHTHFMPINSWGHFLRSESSIFSVVIEMIAKVLFSVYNAM